MKILDQLYQGMIKQELGLIFLVGSFVPIYSLRSVAACLCVTKQKQEPTATFHR